MFTQRYIPPSPVVSPSYRPYLYGNSSLYPSESRGKTEVAQRRSRSPLFNRGVTNTYTPSHNYAYPQVWDLSTGDISPISALWEMCLPAQFCLSLKRLDSMLRRPGYATHYIVRNFSGAIIGFCATFVNYLSHLADDFSGCIAIIIVHPDYRRQGIGTMLHECAYNELENNPKVVRIQLGSTFPRLLHGIPWDTPHLRLWKGLCWEVDGTESGTGAEVSDWLLDFDDLPDISLSSAGLTFEKCEPDDMIKVLDLVEQVILKKDHYGWYEQYAAHNEMLDNIVVGMEGDRVVTAGLLYDPGSGTVSDRDLPWAESIGPDTGGLTCICIADPESPSLVRPDAIMIRLLSACVEILKKSGKTKLFIDGVRGGHLGFQSLGFRKWASYRECFHDIRERSPLKPIVSQVRAQMQAQAAFLGKEEEGEDQDMLG